MRNEGPQIYGPYKHGKKWRVVVISGSAQVARSYSTEAEAIAVKKRTQEISLSITVESIVHDYIAHLGSRGLAASTVRTVEYRLNAFFAGRERSNYFDISKSVAANLYADITTRQSVDTHRNTLVAVKAMGAWAVKTGKARSNPFAAVEPTGLRSRGKQQLRIDEARKLYAKCVELADSGDDGAVAVLTTMLLGLRASEVTNRLVRDLDAGGTILWIEKAKTRAGDRGLAVPDVLRSHLQRLAKGRAPTERLFGGSTTKRGNARDRQWLYHHTHRLCELALVPATSPHALRGLHATVAIAAGADVASVARHLGHSDTKVTTEHYIAPGAIARSRATFVAEILVKNNASIFTNGVLSSEISQEEDVTN